MGKNIFFSVGHPNQDYGILGEYINSSAWECIGELLDWALLAKHPKLHEMIKEESYLLGFYSFTELDKEQFNVVVWEVRALVANLEHPSDLGKNCISAWNEYVEPFLAADSRYEAEPPFG